MTFKEVGIGAEKLLHLAQKTSKNDQRLAVMQLLTAALSICTDEQTFKEFVACTIENCKDVAA